jgi:hypothetical protein
MLVSVPCREYYVPRVHIELQIPHVPTEDKVQTHRYIALSSSHLCENKYSHTRSLTLH